MGNKKDKPSTRWLSFNAEMPMVLLPVYNFLQGELTRILTDDIVMNEIKKVDLGMRRGDYWRTMRNILGDGFKTWNLGANAWYARMLYENIRRLMASGEERRIIYNLLVKHDGDISKEFWEDLHSVNCYPTSGVVRNIQHEMAKGSFTEIPPDARFILDYSTVSDNAIMKELAPRRWLIRTGPNSWVDITICLPRNLREHATGKIAKPRFVRRASDDAYVTCISYEILPDAQVEGENILGGDLGKLKPFSAVSLSPDGIVGDEWLVSHRTQHLIEKYDRIKESLSCLIAKQEQCQALGIEATCSVKYERRKKEIEDTAKKLRNLKDEITNFIALDIVLCALADDSGEIHIEYLSWLDALGGSWNHSEIQTALMNLAPIYGLRVYRVNAKHSSTQSPYSDELGKVNGREVVFEDGWVIDRDFLADVNLAARPVEKGGKRRHVDESLKTRKPRQGRRAHRAPKNRRCLGEKADELNAESISVEVDYSKILSGGTDVVVFSTGVAGLPAARTVTVPVMAENRNLALSMKDMSI